MLQGREQFISNLSLLLKWSPYSTEAELLKQVGSHDIFFFCGDLICYLHTIHNANFFHYFILLLLLLSFYFFKLPFILKA